MIVDEAFVLGRFDAILRGAGELPGYGVSLVDLLAVGGPAGRSLR